MQPSSTITLLVLLFSPLQSPRWTGGLSAGVVGALVDTYDQAAQVSSLMTHLDNHYTPDCLRVVVATLPQNVTTTLAKNRILQTSSLHSSKNIWSDNDFSGSKTELRIMFSPNTIDQVQETFTDFHKNIGKVNPVSCVTYLLSRSPDSHLLNLLADKGPKKRITRYFLVYSQSTADAERFLLDQRLGKEENVAALVQEESQNKSYWRILIRQLLHPSGFPQVLTVNRWSRDTGLTSTENIFPEQMANFYGQKLTGSIMDYIPYSDFHTFEGSLVVELKPCVNRYTLDAIAEQLNFTYEMKMPPDKRWGSLDETGHFVGVVGEVEFERAHFAFDITETTERARNIDFTEYYSIQGITFITAKSRPDPLWRKLITPFRGNVWLCVLVSVGGGSLLYHIIYHAQATLTSSRLLSSNAFMHVLASFLSQSIHSYHSLQAGRVFLGFWFLYAFLVTSYYKTSLTSTLTVPFAPPTLDTLEQLQHSDLNFAMPGAKGIAYTLFQTSDDPAYQYIFKHMQFLTSTAEIMKKVAEGRYAYIFFIGQIQLMTAAHNNDPKRTTDIHMARNQFFPSGIAIAIPQGAPYRRTFNTVLQRIITAGLIDKWVEDTIPLYLKELQVQEEPADGDQQKEGVVPKSATNVVKLTLNHVQGPFFLLFFGYLGGFILLVVEVLRVGFGAT